MIFKSHNGIGHTELNCILDEDELNLSNGDAHGVVFPAVPNGDINHNTIEKKTEEEYSFHPFSTIFGGKKITSYFWLAVSILGSFLTLYMIARLVVKYYRYEISVGVTWNVTNNNPFPSITFCDMNLMVGHYFAYCGVPHGRKYDNYNITCPKDKLNTSWDHKPEPSGSNDKWGNGIYQVLKCHMWDGRPCTDQRYFKSAERLNHTCFTWNYAGNLHDKFGHAYLEFTINENYRNKHSFIFGEIHDPGSGIVGKSNSFRFESSKTYELRIRKTLIKRLPAPYPSKCVTTMPHHIYPGAYSRRSCIDSVYYVKMIKECGDVLDYHKPHMPDDILAKHTRNQTIAEALKCMWKFTSNEITPVDIETCPLACEEMDLYATLTFHDGIHNRPKSKNRVIYAIDVQYQDLDYFKVMEEKPKYSFDELIAEIGGVMCFMIGTSLITLIELSTYIFRRGSGIFPR